MYCFDVFLCCGIQNELSRNIFTEVNYVKIVIFQHYRHDIFADIMNISLYGRNDYGSFCFCTAA